MKKTFKAAIVVLLFFAGLAAVVAYVSTHNLPVLDPKGLIGVKERDLIALSSLLMLVVVIPVFIFALFFSWKYSASNEKARHEPDWEHNYIAEYCWWGVPLVIIAVLAIVTWKSSHDLSPFKPIVTDKKPLEIQVVALQWKWLFIYPEQGVASLNYVQFPEKTPLNFEITSDAPMNSFWIPALGGQIYAMPAMRSKLHLIANERGSYRGSSANISGKGFASMMFTAKATSQKDFEQWVLSIKQSAKPLTLNKYNELVKPSEYVPVAYYNLKNKDLFEQILMKYLIPPTTVMHEKN